MIRVKIDEAVLLVNESVWLFFWVTIGAAVVGSFLTMLVARLPASIEICSGSPFWARLKRLSLPRSQCDHCQKPLPFKSLIPVWSFMWQKGHCTACHEPIGWQALWLELLTILLAASLFWVYQKQGDGVSLLWLFIFFATFLALSFIDSIEGILPDALTLPLLWLGLILNTYEMFVPLSEAVWGAVAGYGSLWLVYQVHYALTKKEGLGYGDFKMFAAVGAWFGWTVLPVVLVVASVVALVFVVIQRVTLHQTVSSVAFGPFIAIATYLVWLGNLAPWWWGVWS